MFNPFKIIRRTVFLIWLCVGLAVSAATLAAWAVNLSVKVATMTATAATTAVKHRKQIASAVTKAKAKARVRRVLVAVPAVGTALAIAFETQDYNDWQAKHPEGTFSDYSCEVAELSAEVVDEVLQELPEMARPSPDTVLAWMPECEASG